MTAAAGVPAATVTFFSNRSARNKREETVALDALAARIHAASAREKSKLPWLKLARFGKLRSEKNSLRHDANVEGVCGVESDYDAGKVPFEAAVKCLSDTGISGLVYTSPSHTPSFPKWRVICYFSRELPPIERARMMGRLAGMFAAIGVEFAGESWTLSQSYYYGSVDRNPAHQVEYIIGTPIDLRSDLDAIAIGKPERARPSGDRRATGPASRPEDITDERIRGLTTTLLDHLHGAGDGEKHHTLLRIARTIGGYLHLIGWSENEAVAQLLAALPASVQDWNLARRTAQDGLRRGIAEPLELKNRPRRKPTHIWRSKDYDFECTPTGREWHDDSGSRFYAEVLSPDGTLSYVPKDELHRKTKNKSPRPAPPGGPPPVAPTPGPKPNGDDSGDEQRLKATGAAKLAELNERYTVVNEAGKVVAVQWRLDPVLEREVLDRIAFDDFKRMFLNRSIEVVTKNGEIESVNLATWWLRHPRRRQFIGGVTFDPTNKAPPDYMNLWRGFAVDPKPGDWSRMQDHILKIICRGDRADAEYVLNWLARLFQHPERHGLIALVLRGKKGTGKGIFARWIVRAFKQHGMHITHAGQFVGRFNDHLRDCVVLFADEAFLVGNRQHEAVLKGLITEPAFVIEGKYRALVTTKNMLHIIIVSNDEWVVPASVDERRFAAFEPLDTRMGDHAYFQALDDQMENGGLAAMIYDLLQRDISKFEVRDVPQNQALRDQKRLSLTSLQAWWLAVLSRGFLWVSKHGAPWFRDWHDFYSTELLLHSYQQWCNETRARERSTREQLGTFFSEWYPSKRPRGKEPIKEIESPIAPAFGADLDDLTVEQQHRPHGYQVGDLDEARDRFREMMTGIEVPWTGDDDV